jgi:hypothetical protein
MKLVKNTIYLSLFAQFIALIYGVYALFLYDKQDILSDIVILESVVQFIEFTFYVIFGFFVANIETLDIAKYRYYDWMITTPTMLLSTMLYFQFTSDYERKREQRLKENRQQFTNQTNQSNQTIISFLQTNKGNVIKAFLSNWAMLLLGYLQEIGIVSIYTSTILGFGFLFYTFYILYQYVNTSISYYLFLFMFIVWNLYGVAAMLKNKYKNTMYNILDIFSKNFFGVFVSYIMIQMIS